MCKAHYGCEYCPIKEEMDDLGETCPFCGALDAAAVEQKIMGWVAENPEPRYPSWKEWREKMFPDSTYMLCPKNFMSQEDSGCDNQTSCIQCMDRPIPADIAEKLGIKPIGGNEND